MRKPDKHTNHEPKGLAVQSVADEEMRIAARGYGRMVIGKLAEIAENGKNEAARVTAMKELLDRGFGKNHLMVREEGPRGTDIQVIFGTPEGVTIEGVMDGRE